MCISVWYFACTQPNVIKVAYNCLDDGGKGKSDVDEQLFTNLLLYENKCLR